MTDAQLQQFHKPGKTYKQVKAVSLRLPNVHGADKIHPVMVYMSTAGTPHFAIGVPSDYANAWKHHRARGSLLSFGADSLFVADGMVTADGFDAVVKKLETIARNFQFHIRNVSMRKVIRVAMEIIGGHGHQSHDAPSFSNSSILVGINSGVFWEVNGAFYQDDGLRRHGQWPFADDSHAEDHGQQPQYTDMVPADMRGDPVTIPYTDEAWATVVQVEATLQRAADTLLALTKVESAQTLLEGGMQALALLAPKAENSHVK